MPVAFDHRDAGVPEADWARDKRLCAAPGSAVPGHGTTLIVLAAHPDDESLGAGGLLAAAARAGAAIVAIIATDGEASHPCSPTHTRAGLAAIRRREAAAAIACLAPNATVRFLALPDGRLDERREALSAAIAEFLVPAAVVVTPWRGDRHPDHEAAAIAARSVLRDRPDCRHWQYPIWAWHWAGGDDLPWDAVHRIEVDDLAAAAKRAALDCYRSQHAPLSDRAGDEAVLGEPMLAHFARPYETYIVEPAHAAGGGSFFDDLYATADDPWGLADRFYERRKRELLLAALPRQRFGRAFEPGCASGLLTERLAARCAEVVACDVAPRAVQLARDRLAGLPNVSVSRRVIPAQWPAMAFDLVVLSEVGYYCDDIAALARRAHSTLTADGALVACHWRHPAADHPRSAAEVHARLGDGLTSIVHHVEDDFFLDVWSLTGESVARMTGVLSASEQDS